MRALLLIILALLPAELLAQQSTLLSWSRPTEYEAVPPSTVRLPLGPAVPLTYNVYGALCSATTRAVLAQGLTGLSWVHNLTDAAGQCWSYHVTAIAAGQESQPSEVKLKTFPLPVPRPPGNVLVVRAVGRGDWVPVFRISASTGARGTAVIGQVQVGTACLGPQAFRYRDLNWHRVAPEAVSWWGSTPTPEVAAPCAV